MTDKEKSAYLQLELAQISIRTHVWALVEIAEENDLSFHEIVEKLKDYWPNDKTEIHS